MDANLRGYFGGTSGTELNERGLNDILMDRNDVGISCDRADVNNPIGLVPSFECNAHEDLDLSDFVLKYISDVLMEEDMEEKTSMFEESGALQAAERSFYEVLGERYPPSPDYPEVPNIDQNIEGPNAVVDEYLCPNWNPDPSEHGAAENVSSRIVSESTSQSSCGSSSSSVVVTDVVVNSPISTLRIPDIFNDSESVMQFKKGVEEASKFLPSGNDWLANACNDRFLGKVQTKEAKGPQVKVEIDYHDYSRGKKNRRYEDEDWQGDGSNKQSATYSDLTVSSQMFDMVLLESEGKSETSLCKALKNTPRIGRFNGGKRNVVDLRTLLTLCAQAVAADDWKNANEFLKQITVHSSQTGDGMQRLAHYFANGLEARLAGTGTQIYKALLSLPTSAGDALKAYHLYLATCPFRTISNFFANRTIMNVSERATRLLIIDFGIRYGFQWPSLIQRMSYRTNGPPKLRITGIDLPCPGFRPSARVDETGRRLANYAETFKVPFEFNAIAQNWETIKMEDLKIEEGEVVVVNCLYRFRHLLDETVIVNSPRNIVLNLIKKIKPDVFIHGIRNGAYKSPFFISRFREALHDFSSMFDMLEANIPREIHERMLIEKSIFGRQAMNVIACEDAERIERPETYKQWQVRNVRAGFKQLQFDEELVKMAKTRVKSSYHKEFFIDEDGQWLLQEWKGPVLFALSSWKPTD